MVDHDSRQHVLQACRDHDVKFIRLWFTDILGMLKSVAITAEELEHALRRGEHPPEPKSHAILSPAAGDCHRFADECAGPLASGQTPRANPEAQPPMPAKRG